MKRILCTLTLTVAVGAFAQAKLEVRVAPKSEEKKETASVDPAMKAKVDALVVKLGDDDRKVRKQAKTDLVALGKTAMVYLVSYLKGNDPEVRLAVQEILKEIAFNHARSRDVAEPDDLRKRALLNGEKPQTTGERKWLIEKKKAIVAEMKAQEEAARRVAEEKAKAEAAKKESK